MNTTYFAFLSALLRTIGDNLSAFFGGDGDLMAHYRNYQGVFETYATGFGPFGWTLYGFSLLMLTGLLLSLGLFVAYLIRRLPHKRKEGANALALVPGEKETNPTATRFPKLRALDELFAANPPLPEAEEENLSLEKICTDFRDYCAFSWGLYYDIGLIRGFVSALASSRLLLLEGVSGTGKTSLPCRFADFLGGFSDVIPVEPSWREKGELLGYYNDFNREYRLTPFLESLYRALYETGIHFLVLDEVNLSRIEYYFAEFLSLLELPEEEKRLIPLIGEAQESDPAQLRDGKLPLGNNVYFIGTANHDESTFAITDKVYDRAFALSFSRQGEPFIGLEKHPLRISHERLRSLFEQAIAEYRPSQDSLDKIEQFFGLLEGELGIVIGNRIRRQMECYLPAYLACGGKELEAIDAFFVSKILRKIEGISPAKAMKVVALFPQIEALFGKDALPLTYASFHVRNS